MNRAEYRRRKKADAKKQKTYTLTQEQLDAILQDHELQIMHLAFVVMLSMSCLALRDAFGFSTVRLTRFMDNVMVKYECFIEDQRDKMLSQYEKYDFAAMINVLKKETGVDILSALEKDVEGKISLRKRG